jgi:hypothetical protein
MAGKFGGKQPGAGRPRGSVSQKTLEVQAYAKGVVEDPEVRAQILAQAQAGLLPPPVMTMLFHYAYGRPKETIDVTVEQTVYQVEMA